MRRLLWHTANLALARCLVARFGEDYDLTVSCDYGSGLMLLDRTGETQLRPWCIRPRLCNLAGNWTEWLRKQRVRTRQGPYGVAVLEGIQAALCMPLLRGLGIAQKCVFFVQDWFPASRKFQYMTTVCSGMADDAWVASKPIQARLAAASGENPDRYPVFTALRSVASAVRYPGRQLLYAGGIRKDACLLGVIDAMAQLRDECPFTLLVIGKEIDSGMVDALRRRAEEDGLGAHVKIEVTDGAADLSGVYAHSAAGISLYDGAELNYSNLTLTTKLHDYLCHGLPVVHTSIALRDTPGCEAFAFYTQSVSVPALVSVFKKLHERLKAIDVTDIRKCAERIESDEALRTRLNKLYTGSALM